jgi:hypothetical protein
MARSALAVDEVIRPSPATGSTSSGSLLLLHRRLSGGGRAVGIPVVLAVAEDAVRGPTRGLRDDHRRRRTGSATTASRKGARSKRVRAGFLKLAKRDRRRIRVIDAARPSDEVFADVRKAVDRVL